MKDQIYALYYEYADQRQYFYVGRTNDPKRRLQEHRRNSNNKTHKEDVYQFIRERCQPNGIDVWDMEVLVSEENTHPEDCEDFWVVLMIRAGYDLKNMKRGDLHRIALTMLSKRQGDFETVSEFVEFRKRVEKEIKEELAAYERSKRLKNNILEETPNPNINMQEFFANLREQQENLIQRRQEEQLERERKQRLREAQWEADRPAREARLKAETERLMREAEEQRQQIWKEFGVTQSEYEQECVRRQQRDESQSD